MKKLSLIIFFFGFVVSLGSAEKELVDTDVVSLKNELVKIMGEKTADELIEKGEVLSYKYNEPDIDCVIEPSLSVLKKMNSADSYRYLKPVFLMENMYLFKKPVFEKKSGKTKSVDVGKILKSISKLEGLEYYSHSRKKMRTLYENSFVVKKIVAGKKSKYEKIADPLNKPTNGLKILACQEDLTFGKYIYSYEYFEENGAVGTICSNTENLKYSIFKVISKNNLQVRLVVKELSDFVLVYSSTSTNFVRLAGLEKKLKNSFSSRTNAMFNWFLEQYQEEAKKIIN